MKRRKFARIIENDKRQILMLIELNTSTDKYDLICQTTLYAFPGEINSKIILQYDTHEKALEKMQKLNPEELQKAFDKLEQQYFPRIEEN